MKKRLFTISIVIAVALSLTACNSSNYKKATSLYEKGQYAEAAEQFKTLGEYKDSAEMVLVCKYAEASSLFDSSNYEKAKLIFSEIADYENSAEMVRKCDYEIASALFSSGDYDGAKAIFSALSDYEDSADMVKECDYKTAETLYTAGDTEGALIIYETLSGYKDADDKAASIKKELMYQNYGDVINILTKETWYFNGGADSVLDSISFTDSKATIAQVYYDGNGKHDNGSNDYDYLIDDKNISLTLADGSRMDISYKVDGETVLLGDGEYFTAEEIDEGIQGYWTYSSVSVIGGKYEHYICFDNGEVTSERAAEAYGYSNGEYYYYGPYEGYYKIAFGGFETDMMHGSEWYFNIIDGVVTILHYDNVCTPADGFPGEDGYSF